MTSANPSEQAARGCELCGASDAQPLYTAHDRLGNSEQPFIIAACRGCGVRRTLPEMTERELAPFYPKDYWGEEDEPSQEWIRRSQSEKTDFLRACGLEGGTILDVGCGSGLFLRALDGERWRLYGVELGEVAARIANRALGGDRVFCGTLREAACADDYFDVVTFWSSLEHTNEPRAALLEARRILKRGGTLIVQVPNAGSYQARWFGGQWFALDAPRHRYHFTPARLTQLLDEIGFEVTRTTFASRAHNLHALRQSLKSYLRAGRPLSPGRLLFLLALPFLKPLDAWMTRAGRGATITLAATRRS